MFRRGDIFAPSDYLVLMRNARSKQPYVVHSLDHRFFKNYDSLTSNYASICPGKRTNDPVVTDIRGLLYLPSGEVLYKLRHSENWATLPCRRKCSPSPLNALYAKPLSINAAKFLNLQELKAVIPHEYHAFYDNLLHEEN